MECNVQIVQSKDFVFKVKPFKPIGTRLTQGA